MNFTEETKELLESHKLHCHFENEQVIRGGTKYEESADGLGFYQGILFILYEPGVLSIKVGQTDEYFAVENLTQAIQTILMAEIHRLMEENN